MANRLRIAAFGEERPAYTTSREEDCRSKNRRGWDHLDWRKNGIDSHWYGRNVTLPLIPAWEVDVRDGVLEIYLNGAGSPTYSVPNGNIGVVTEAGVSAYLSSFLLGTQLSVVFTDPGYSEYRYWDNVAYSPSRGGPP